MLPEVFAKPQAWNALWNQYFALQDRYFELQLVFATSVRAGLIVGAKSLVCFASRCTEAPRALGPGCRQASCGHVRTESSAVQARAVRGRRR